MKWLIFVLLLIPGVVFANVQDQNGIPPTNAFQLINGTGGNVTATAWNDFVTLVEGTGILITYDYMLKQITITSTATGDSPDELYCSGTDKFRAYNATTNSFVCATDASGGGGGGSHTILNSTSHTDAADQTVSVGSIIYGDATPEWNELTIGANNTVLKSNGVVPSWNTVNTASISGVADPKLAILTAAGAIIQYNNSPERATINGTNFDYLVLDFNNTSSETAIWSFEMPSNFYASGTINATVSFQVASGTAGVCWDGSWLGLVGGDTVDSSFGTVIGGCDSSTGTNKVEQATLSFSSAQHGLSAGDIAYFKLARDVADGTDTNTNDARLINVRVTWG